MTQKQNILLPVPNCWVRQTLDNGGERTGRVMSAMYTNDDIEVTVKWIGGHEVSKAYLSELRCGFKPAMDVQDRPRYRTSKTLGEGTVIKTRIIGGREQVMVDFPSIGRQLWLPYENLAQIKGTRHRFTLGDKGPQDSAERFRLKSLAYALELWNENTGSLSHLEIDPLPHQIHLVHHILASGNLNWMIADDVGLGKTIETGMLFAALKQRGNLNRVLLVTPAGLTKQWQDELNNKFRMSEFQIYGEDFSINEPRHWKMYDFVIASIDRLKDPNNLDSLKQAGIWDLIVFDEAHRLSRRQYGLKLNASQRFELAANLRGMTDSMILLTATPHQGMQDKFQALLELLRPERKDQITTLALNPEIIGEMMFRNNKADVTDAEGNFIFKGKTTRAITVNVSAEAIEFDRKLQHYLKEGYAAASNLGIRGNAIGFVMTVYRKLAASSVAAIHQALINRKARLEGEAIIDFSMENVASQDERYIGELEEQLNTDVKEFFEGEMELLTELIEQAGMLRDDDKKIQFFMNELVDNIIANHSDQKVLIFTEYRTTQQYIKNTLEARFGDDSVELINGSMPHSIRREAINRFEEGIQFLISTEAGGEGINLQQNCHIMVNYDLPWNPMRLVQRIGRLYRYGQQKRVIVFNIHSPETADEQIIDLMYSRIDQVVEDLSGVSTEYNDGLRDEILGDIADLVDINQILEEAIFEGITRTKERIDEALNKAREASVKQRELFEHAASFNPNETKNELKISKQHVEAFVLGMFELLGIEIVDSTHNNLVWHIRLPENVQQEIGSSRKRYEVTLSRSLAASSRRGTHMLDMDSFLMHYLLDKAKSYDFHGLSAVICDCNLRHTAILTSVLRWQNDQGQRLRQEFTVFGISEFGKISVNPESFSEWLKRPATTGDVVISREKNKVWFEIAEQEADKRLAEVSNLNLHPENKQWISGGWVEDTS